MKTRAICKLQEKKKPLIKKESFSDFFFRGRSVKVPFEFGLFKMQVLPQKMENCVIGKHFLYKS